jgi:1-acyl-sn-glycerol-3-phosphate acyltransferase
MWWKHNFVKQYIGIMDIIARFRSYCFDVFFYVFTISLFIILWVPVIILPRWCCVLWYKTWTHIIMFSLKLIVGLDYKILGQEKLDESLKNGPVILACKHQSAWETLIFSTLVKRFVIVLKKQLTQIPGYGSYLVKLNSIVIDRSNGMKSLKSLIAQGKKSIDNNFSILIFPEGRRGAYGQPGNYQSGIGILYQELNVTVVPISLNSGKFWARRSKFKKPGCITLEFLDPIPAGLPRTEFMQLLQERIESGCAKL